jgi:hypothetical protein
MIPSLPNNGKGRLGKKISPPTSVAGGSPSGPMSKLKASESQHTGHHKTGSWDHFDTWMPPGFSKSGHRVFRGASNQKRAAVCSPAPPTSPASPVSFASPTSPPLLSLLSPASPVSLASSAPLASPASHASHPSPASPISLAFRCLPSPSLHSPLLHLLGVFLRRA